MDKRMFQSAGRIFGVWNLLSVYRAWVIQMFQSAGRIFGVWNRKFFLFIIPLHVSFNPPGGFLASGTVQVRDKRGCR